MIWGWKHEEMSEEGKAKMRMIADKMGMDNKMMTDDMMMGMKVSVMGGMKMMKEMKDQGMSEADSMAMMKKFSDTMMSPEMMAELKKMKEMKEDM